jgi:predicted TIM-barrel fold metal-dependent hydrolase
LTSASEDAPVCIPYRDLWRDQPLPIPLLGDEEGARVAAHLPPVVDAHVHLFPDRVLEAIYRWFHKNAWEIRYPLRAGEISAYLFSRGISRVVGLHYAHRPGMARALNHFMAEVVKNEPRVTGLATVLPGEPDAVEILEEGFALGLSGVKLHCHVQCFSPDSAPMHALYEACVRAGKPMVIHAGREPALSSYACDPYALCGVERVERVLRDHPALQLCVAHLGADEVDGYGRLLERYDHLWLDTTMTLADFLPMPFPSRVIESRPERILYGSDFPILPFAWDRELRHFERLRLSPEQQAQILGQNALALFDAG